jgi:hypothetical protein
MHAAMMRTATTSTTLAFTLVFAIAGCKDKPKTNANPTGSAATGSGGAPDPAAAGSGSAVVAFAPALPTLVPAAGESLAPGADLERVGENPVLWKPPAAGMVAIGFVFQGEQARVVAATAGAAASLELGTVEFNAAYSGAYGGAQTADGKVVLVLSSTGGSGDPGFTAAWRVAWDSAKQLPVVEERGDWPGDGEVPGWASLPGR